ncbi:hypothetical protein BHM03_00011957 [Ensete ventricosum]|nr:hypothetical protein BHM03_00011957 [Ensete ventricosum]
MGCSVVLATHFAFGSIFISCFCFRKNPSLHERYHEDKQDSSFVVSKSKGTLRDMHVTSMMQLIEVQGWENLTQLVEVNLELKGISMVVILLYCPCCKKHQQAVKKLDLWRLPEVMVIHLLRFSYSQHKENKLETFVDYPVDDLDMSPYVSSGGTDKASYHYRLYAISNHYGSLGGGHYTAYVYDEGVDGWFKFDDENVVYIDEVDDVKTSAAYLLFYRRV